MVQSGTTPQSLRTETLASQITDFVDPRLPLAGFVVEERPLNLTGTAQVADAHSLGAASILQQNKRALDDGSMRKESQRLQRR